MIKLNLGCGYDKKEGFINVDISKEVNPDRIMDLLKFPYPFDDDSVDYILARDVLEHIPKNKLMNVLDELYKISKSNAIWEIRVPFYNNCCARANLLHFRGFDFNSFDFLKPNKKLESHYTKTKLKVIYAKGEPTPCGRFIPFKKFLRHSIGELYNIINFKLKVIK